MNIIITTGKGGVGKTLTACSIALALSSKSKTVLLDYDGGHSVKQTLGITTQIPKNKVLQIKDNLWAGVIENYNFISAKKIKTKEVSFDDYFVQFPNHLGFLAYCDMVNAFFGLPTDIDGVQKFISLLEVYVELEKMGIENLVIDLEPTAGFKRFLENSESNLNSLNNLKKNNFMLLAAIKFVWPDIQKFLKSGYVKNIDIHTEAMQNLIDKIKQASFYLISIPQEIPVDQLYTVRHIIEDFGGKPKKIVVNNVKGDLYEKEVIKRLHDMSLPIIKIPYKKDLHTTNNKWPILKEIGQKILK